ncbi:MAG: dpo [Dehalococcoidia bacterium]|nr:dpo [Dehalococcoidia bacterium]
MSLLAELAREIMRCQDCDLHRTSTRAVPGEGPENASIVFIGEAPGWNEDQQGRPFVGPAGQFLDQLLASANLPRDKVYITNIVKHRPPSNRDPLRAEMKACEKWLDKQLEIIKPKIIVTLGRYSMAKFLSASESISKIHGVARKMDNMVVVPMYHPAAALHQQSLRKTIEADFQKLPQVLAGLEQVEVATPAAQQLSMF